MAKKAVQETHKSELPKSESKKDPQNILLQYEPGNIQGDIIGKISSSYYYVRASSRIEHLARALDKDVSIIAVGVVDENDDILGVVTRKELFDVLGKPYGRDLLYFKLVQEIIQPADIFYFDQNIYSVMNTIGGVLYEAKTRYYLLRTGNKRFAGVFTTKDLLMHLSKITQKDLDFARSVQSRIIKDQEFIERHCFNTLGASKMAKGVGGDYYAFKKINEDRWVLGLFDISGKGLAASLITAIIGGMFSSFDFNNSGVERFIVTLNNYLLQTFQLEKYSTGIIVDFNEATGKCVIYDMGQDNLFLYRSKQLKKFIIKNRNMPMGILPDIKPKANVFRLEKGDMLFSFTDGLSEQTDARKRRYSIQVLSQILKDNARLGIDRLPKLIFNDIKTFRQHHPQHDDITLFFLEYKGCF